MLELDKEGPHLQGNSVERKQLSHNTSSIADTSGNKPLITTLNSVRILTLRLAMAGVTIIAATGFGTGAASAAQVSFGTWKGIFPVHYIQFDWTETTKAYRSINKSGKAAKAVCSFIPNAPAARVCRAGVQLIKADIKKTLTDAVNKKRCMKLRLPVPGTTSIAAYDSYHKKCVK